MKRLLVCLALVLALALPTQALAKTREYAGTVAPSGTLEFKWKKKKKGKPKVKGLTFRQVPIACDGGPNTTFGKVTGGLTVKKKRFGAQLTNEEGTSNLHIAGSVSKSGSGGTIQIFGAAPLETPLPDGSTTGSNCDTGVLNWTASRA
jgi:hypothetical protein